MPRAVVRFYAELNDHLPAACRHRTLYREFTVPGSVKDFIESFGVPHTEVDLVTIGGEPVEFARLVQDGDRVAVYPVFEALDITAATHLRPTPLREPKFVLDAHLGRLAAYLRMLGLDAAYGNSAEDGELARISADEHRILLTRDRGLLMRSAVTHGYWLRETAPRRQAAEIVRRFDLARRIEPFTRCMACNAPLVPVAKEAIAGRVPPAVAASRQEFRECPACGRVYWQGTHYQRMRRWIEELAPTGGA